MGHTCHYMRLIMTSKCSYASAIPKTYPALVFNEKGWKKLCTSLKRGCRRREVVNMKVAWIWLAGRNTLLCLAIFGVEIWFEFYVFKSAQCKLFKKSTNKQTRWNRPQVSGCAYVCSAFRLKHEGSDLINLTCSQSSVMHLFLCSLYFFQLW